MLGVRDIGATRVAEVEEGARIGYASPFAEVACD
jgi:hypothetical protein